ncbi:glycosyltransferase family 2 protein [Aeromonas veronii]|uniref:glycosyltransferase family 2 protein n=1 Tax=Aeromonas veronii TaxID=654 RepID=UPI0038D3017E
MTPTYNRYHTLQRLYDSLCRQVVVNKSSYEWVVVDDGSIDDTKELIYKFSAEDKINIKYIYQNNAGKPSAINSGVSIASGEYVFIVDSDDLLTQNALEQFFEVEYSISDELRNNISGFCFGKGDLDGFNLSRVVVTPNSSLMTATECGDLYKSDLAYVFKKEYLERNVFPSYIREKFIPELFIWNKITDEKPVLVLQDKVIYLCEYLEDGLSRNFKSQLKANPRGFALFYRDQIYREKKLSIKIKRLIRLLQCYVYFIKKEFL